MTIEVDKNSKSDISRKNSQSSSVKLSKKYIKERKTYSLNSEKTKRLLKIPEFIKIIYSQGKFLSITGKVEKEFDSYINSKESRPINFFRRDSEDFNCFDQLKEFLTNGKPVNSSSLNSVNSEVSSNSLKNQTLNKKSNKIKGLLGKRKNVKESYLRTFDSKRQCLAFKVLLEESSVITFTKNSNLKRLHFKLHDEDFDTDSEQLNRGMSKMINNFKNALNSNLAQNDIKLKEKEIQEEANAILDLSTNSLNKSTIATKISLTSGYSIKKSKSLYQEFKI